MKTLYGPTGNLFSPEGGPGGDEHIATILKTGEFILERIVSQGHATPEGMWLDQENDEWVVLLSGGAGLRFDDGRPELEMRPGDHLLIPARQRHRVEWTASGQKTVWLALHFRNQDTCRPSNSSGPALSR